ncbi:MAG: hypothetical protein O7157_01595, partial [Wolbachia endosymbiont of Tetragnatha montana]|nr:hypothetical protein [Wolbachia endosymbiont of Tetragnatha montana]
LFHLVRTWGKIRGKNVVDIFDITSKWPKPLSKATESSSCHCLVLYSFSQSVNGYGNSYITIV